MTKRAIICVCGLAKPCEKSDCQHSTAIALRNKVIQENNSKARVEKAKQALAALQGDEWYAAHEDHCLHCGGPHPCYCMSDE